MANIEFQISGDMKVLSSRLDDLEKVAQEYIQREKKVSETTEDTPEIKGSASTFLPLFSPCLMLSHSVQYLVSSKSVLPYS
jgi:hypothetical protein